MASTALEKIRRRTKQIMKAHPNKSFRAAQKEAGREYREGHKPKGTRKKPAKKKAAKKAGRVGKLVNYKGGSVSVGAVPTSGDAKRSIVNSTKEQLAWKLLAQSQAKTKTDKRKAAKVVQLLKKKLRTAESL